MTGEPGLAGVRSRCIRSWRATLGSAPLITSATTDTSGRYRVTGLSAGLVVRDQAGHRDPSRRLDHEQHRPGATVRDADRWGAHISVDIGYYDPLSTAPMRQSDWKKELKQAGKPRYTPAQIDGFVAAIEAPRASGVFTEVVGIRDGPVESPLCRAIWARRSRSMPHCD